jgi:adenylylsulfate kinase-like enzyme
MTSPEGRGRVVLFTGPTGAGKSTVGLAWATSRERPTGFIDHDETRFLLRAGYVSRSAAAADPSLRPQADEQWLLAARVCEAVAEEYTRSGYDLAVAAFRPPGEWMGCWRQLDAMSPLIIVLLPTVEVCLDRDGDRAGRARTGEDSIRRAFSYDWEPWHKHPLTAVIDNSTMTVEETVAQVEALAKAVT